MADAQSCGQLTEMEPLDVEVLFRVSVAVMVQFHVPVGDVWMTSPFAGLVAVADQDELFGADADPDRPPGPEMEKVAVPPDSSTIDALTVACQAVMNPAPTA